MSERSPETYACIQAWYHIAEDHDHARKLTLETIEQLTKRIEVLEQAILKNVDISWEPWKSLFPQPGESQ